MSFRSAGTLLLRILVLLAVLLLTLAAFHLPLGPSLGLLWEGAAGDKFALSRTMVKATPLLMTGLGMVVAWRAGAFNIGGEGQFIVGGLFGATAAKLLVGHEPAGVVTAAILLAGIVGGALWAGLAGWLQVKRGVEAVISTILLNFVAIELMRWAVEGPLQEAVRHLPQTDSLPPEVMLFRPDRQMDLNVGSLVGLAAAGAVWVYLYRTRPGFLVRLVGDNPRVARANRIDAGAAKLQAFLVSGALCGLAGGCDYTGPAGLIGEGFSQGWGFMGIPVALLAGLHPLAAVFSALYFGALLAGSENLGMFTHGGPTLVYVVQATAVLAYVALQSDQGRQILKSMRRPAWIRSS